MKILLTLALITLARLCYPQTNPMFFSIQPQYGFILKHSHGLNYLNNTRPYGVEMSLAWHLVSDSIYYEYGLNPKVGGYLTVLNYYHSTLGYAVPVGIYFEPFFRTDKKLALKLKGGAGFAYTSNPYDSVSNPLNVAYSMKITGHAFLGIGLNYKISEQSIVGFKAAWHHFSNGAIKEPNKGLNIPSVQVNFDYCLSPGRYINRIQPSGMLVRRNRYEIGVYEAKKTSVSQNKRFSIYGVYINYSHQLSKVNALTGGSEFVINTYLRESIWRNPAKSGDHKRFNLLAGHEFRMGKVAFSQTLGVYIYAPNNTNDAVYQRYGLTYRFKPGITVGTNIKAHRHVGDYIDFRLGYSLER